MQSKTEVTAHIQVANVQGETFTIIESTHYHRPSHMDDVRAEWLPGLRSYRCGRSYCNKINDASFEVVETGERLSKI